MIADIGVIWETMRGRIWILMCTVKFVCFVRWRGYHANKQAWKALKG